MSKHGSVTESLQLLLKSDASQAALDNASGVLFQLLNGETGSTGYCSPKAGGGGRASPKGGEGKITTVHGAVVAAQKAEKVPEPHIMASYNWDHQQ